MWNDFVSQSFLKSPNAPLALRVFTGVSQWYCWGFPGQNTSKTYAPNIPKILEKIHLNTSQNRCQNLPKSSPRPSKIKVWRGSAKNPFLNPKFSTPGRRLGAPWGRPGGILGASWARLGAVLGSSWESWGVLGASWGRLETSWGRLGVHFIANST